MRHAHLRLDNPTYSRLQQTEHLAHLGRLRSIYKAQKPPPPGPGGPQKKMSRPGRPGAFSEAELENRALAKKLRALAGAEPRGPARSQYSKEACAQSSTARFARRNAFTQSEKLAELQDSNLQQMKRLTALKSSLGRRALPKQPPSKPRRDWKVRDLGVWFDRAAPDPLKELAPGADIRHPTARPVFKPPPPAEPRAPRARRRSPSHSRSRLQRPAGKPEAEEEPMDESREISYQIRAKSGYFILVEKLQLRGAGAGADPARPGAEPLVALELRDYSGAGPSRWKAEESGTFRKSCRGLRLAVWLLDKAAQSLEHCGAWRWPPGPLEEQVLELAHSRFVLKLLVFGSDTQEDSESDAPPKQSGMNGREAELPVSGADESRLGNFILQQRQLPWDASNNSTLGAADPPDKKLHKHDSLRDAKPPKEGRHYISMRTGGLGLGEVEERREQDISLEEDPKEGHESKPILAGLNDTGPLPAASFKDGSYQFEEDHVKEHSHSRERPPFLPEQFSEDFPAPTPPAGLGSPHASLSHKPAEFN